MSDKKLIKPFSIGICGYAGSGKDSLAKIIIDSNPSFDFIHLALAEELKNSLKDFCEAQFGISPFTTDRSKKSLIRPVLVEVARVKRVVTKGRFYTKILTQKINKAYFENKVPIVSDIRYTEYEQDEAFWIKNEQNGILIHIEREGVQAPNQDELDNDPKLKELSDICIKWPNLESPERMSKWLDDNGFLREVSAKITEKAYGK